MNCKKRPQFIVPHSSFIVLVAVATIAAAAAIAASAPTAAAAAAIAAPTATTAPAAPAAAPLFARLGLVDGERPAFEVGTIEGFDGFLGLAVVVHFHKPKPTRSAGLPVRNHLSSGHRTVPLKQGHQVVGCAIPNQIADVDILRHSKENLSVLG